MSHRFARNGWPRASENIAATITASATPHAEGTYTELDASTAQDVIAIYGVCAADVFQAGVDTSELLTLAIGAAASEQDVVVNIPVGGHERGLQWWAPLHIPAGTRLSAKLRAEQVSDTYIAALTLMYGSPPGWGGYATATTYGAVTANSTGTVLSNTAGTYTQITASTTDPIRAVGIYFGLVDSTASDTTHVVDIGVGGAGSEVIIGTSQISTAANESLDYYLGAPWLEVSIPTGSRIAVKKSTTTDLSCVLIGYR